MVSPLTPLGLVTLLSGSRFVASLLLLTLVLRQHSITLGTGIVIYIYLSDVVDGFLARRWKVTSVFGYLLDGLADRSSYLALLLCALVMMGAPVEAVFLLVMRDLVLYGYRSLDQGWYQRGSGQRVLTKGYAFGMKLVLGLYWLVLVVGEAEVEMPSLVIDVLHAALWFQVAFSYATLWLMLRGR